VSVTIDERLGERKKREVCQLSTLVIETLTMKKSKCTEAIARVKKEILLHGSALPWLCLYVVKMYGESFLTCGDTFPEGDIIRVFKYPRSLLLYTHLQ